MGDAPPARIALRPIAEADEAELRRIHGEAEVSRWWGEPDEDFPLDEPGATRLAIELEGRVVGLVQFSEELEPRYRHASLDLFLDPAVHGRGIGPEALREVVRHLIEDRGHHRLTIDPAAANTAAIRAYEKVGFRVVGVMRNYERDAHGTSWHDGLLMELLAEDVRPGLARSDSRVSLEPAASQTTTEAETTHERSERVDLRGPVTRQRDRPVYAMLARVPARGAEHFAAYEARVLPLLAEHGGTLVRRLRSDDGHVELHLVSFPSGEALIAYRDDERRREQRHLLERSGAVIELLELYDV